MEKVKKAQKQKSSRYDIFGLYSVALLIPVMSIPVIYSVLLDISHRRTRTPEEIREENRQRQEWDKRPTSGGNGWEM